MIHVVTGGAGFLGSHLVDRLLHDNPHNRVVVLDNFFTGAYDNLTVDRHVEVVRHDVCVPFHVECDFIWHLACPAAPVHYVRNPARTLRTAVLGTLNALDLARETGARLLVASTSEIYGDPTEHPQRESYQGCVDPWALRSVYDEGKRAAETACFAYAKQRNVQVRIVRIFNTYGPRMARSDGRVIPAFIDAALHGKPIELQNGGAQTRSFCYVDDLVDGLVRFMSSSVEGPVNLGNPCEVAVRDLAQQIIDITKSTSSIVVADHPIGNDPQRRCPDIVRARELLGWEPKVTLRDGLERMIAWAREAYR